jgi:alpha-ketoglutarate-dependent taurine dioxygenase
MVEVKDATKVTDAERAKLQTKLNRYNMVLYRTSDTSENKMIPLSLGYLFGLQALDSNLGAGADAVTEIRVKETGVHGRYIPYTTKKLNWHTDGYYNALDKQIRAMSLHCVRPAATGGENALLDHEMAYIHLRDLNPEHIQALCMPDAMTIPENVVDGQLIRDAQTGPVFSFDTDGQLHMRYSARKRNIKWKNTAKVKCAVIALEAMFDQCEWILRAKLSTGEGLICNNVLHNRDGFEDHQDATRLLYRLRYYDRAATSVSSELTTR